MQNKRKKKIKGSPHFAYCINCGKLFYIRLKKSYILTKWFKNRKVWFCSLNCYKKFLESKNGNKD